MKLLLLGVFLYSCISVCGQHPKTTTLKFTAQDCRLKRASLNFPVAIFRFYKLPEDTLAFRIDLHKLDKSSVVLENIPVSEYRLEYTDMYIQRIQKNISVRDTTENVVVVCPDSLNRKRYKQNTIAKLKTNDSIVVHFVGGHMIFRENRIVIKKTDTNVVATLYRRSEREMQFEIKTVTLSEENISDFVRFENEITAVKEKWCSATSEYSITSKYLNLYKTGGECTWSGFAMLWSSFSGNLR